MTLVVFGRVGHRQMQLDKVEKALRKHLPGLLVTLPDFSVERSWCRVEIFCNTTLGLDFTVTPKSNTVPAPAAVAVLVREAENINEVLLKALGRPFQRAKISYCYLEDERSRSRLLNWAWEPPLKSRAAVFSYILCFVLLVIAGILVYGLFRQHPSASRNYNIVSLIAAICLPALTLPLPFVYEHLRVRGSGRWIFSQTSGGSS